MSSCILSCMYDDSTIILNDANLALVEELRSVRETSKSLKAREDEIRKILLEALKYSEQGITASGVPMIEVQRQPRTRVDGNRLQALYQDVWDDCQIATTVEVLRLPEAL